MAKKSELTTQYIIEKVAPVFNTMGYKATSMTDITRVTGLTKGAIYGNFENKEHLAVEAFNYNVRTVIWKLADLMNMVESPHAKLQIMTHFYRNYYNDTIAVGGCPLLNVGVDSNNMNPQLHQRVVTVLKKLQKNMIKIVKAGQEQGEFKASLDAKVEGKRLVSLIEGAVFTASMLKDPQHLSDTMDFVDQMIKDYWTS